VRLDKYLVLEGYFESRNRAHEAIKSGQVTVDGHPSKPSARIGDVTRVEVADARYYVSRAARKLEGFLSEYPLELEGRRALDIGSSTGGFTQILLEQGVVHVDCVDVGRDQLHASLRRDPRVSVHEQTDIREFTTETPYDVIVSDVSFISLLHILDVIDRLAGEGTRIVLLFKPQFEVGREVKRDSRGVVTDEGAILRAMDAFELATAKLGWQRTHKVPSRYRGREGNQETVYLYTINNRPQTPL
jgi:23S rRNA (cytidine1920-2'-O)/16S rRNA (cytidine1409-2'-O)-methyltransferase